MSEVCVIGSFVMDMCANVESFPEPGQTVIAQSIRFSPGGKGCNQCVAAARLQTDCEMIGMVGEDDNGKAFLDLLKQENIELSNVFVSKKEPTGCSQIQIDCHGENKIVVIPGANYDFVPDLLLKIKDKILSSKIIVLQMELPFNTLYAILDFCKEHKKTVLLNPAPAKKIPQKYFSAIDYLTPNETELRILTSMPCSNKEEQIQALQALLDQGVKHIIATLGAKGCVIADVDGIRFFSGYSVNVVDTVAAGDAFHGALIKGIVEERSLEECVAFANAAGALAVTKVGAITSLPTLMDVEHFLNNQKQEVA